MTETPGRGIVRKTARGLTPSWPEFREERSGPPSPYSSSLSPLPSDGTRAFCIFVLAHGRVLVTEVPEARAMEFVEASVKRWGRENVSVMRL
jgi:hypothetical protein